MKKRNKNLNTKDKIKHLINMAFQLSHAIESYRGNESILRPVHGSKQIFYIKEGLYSDVLINRESMEMRIHKSHGDVTWERADKCQEEDYINILEGAIKDLEVSLKKAIKQSILNEKERQLNDDVDRIFHEEMNDILYSMATASW